MALLKCLTFPSLDECANCPCLGGFKLTYVLLCKLIVLKDGGTLSHFRKNLLHSLSIRSTWDMGKSYNRKGHCSRGIMPYWKHQTLNLPSNGLRSTDLSQVFSWALVLTRLLLSVRELSYCFPRHLILWFWIVGTSAPCMVKVFLASFPFRILRLLDFSGLNCRRDHIAIFSRALRIHCVPWIEGVITVTSSMKAQQAGCLVPSSPTGPLHCVVPAVSNRFIAAINRVTEIVHPAMMPFSSLCHLVVMFPTVNLICRLHM